MFSSCHRAWRMQAFPDLTTWLISDGNLAEHPTWLRTWARLNPQNPRSNLHTVGSRNKRLSHSIHPPVANTQSPHEVIDIIDAFLARFRIQENHETPCSIAVDNSIFVLKGLDMFAHYLVLVHLVAWKAAINGWWYSGINTEFIVDYWSTYATLIKGIPVIPVK